MLLQLGVTYFTLKFSCVYMCIYIYMQHSPFKDYVYTIELHELLPVFLVSRKDADPVHNQDLRRTIVQSVYKASVHTE